MGFLKWIAELFSEPKPFRYKLHYLEHPNRHSAKCYCGAAKSKVIDGYPIAHAWIGTKKQVKNCWEKGYQHLIVNTPSDWYVCAVCGWRNPKDF